MNRIIVIFLAFISFVSRASAQLSPAEAKARMDARQSQSHHEATTQPISNAEEINVLRRVIEELCGVIADLRRDNADLRKQLADNHPTAPAPLSELTVDTFHNMLRGDVQAFLIKNGFSIQTDSKFGSGFEELDVLTPLTVIPRTIWRVQLNSAGRVYLVCHIHRYVTLPGVAVGYPLPPKK